MYTLLSEKSQSENATFYMTPTIGNSGKGTTMGKIKVNSCQG